MTVPTMGQRQRQRRQSSSRSCAFTVLVVVVVIIVAVASSCHALSSTSKQPPRQTPNNNPNEAKPPPRSPTSSSSNKTKKKNKFGTIADVMQAALRDPNAFSSSNNNSANSAVSNSANGRREVNANGRFIDIGSGNKGRRTRKRVDRPRQQYVYAGQRRTGTNNSGGAAGGSGATGAALTYRSRSDAFAEFSNIEDYSDDDDEYGTEERTPTTLTANLGSYSNSASSQQQAKERAARMEYLISLGLSDPYNSQVADALVGDGPEEVPHIVESIRLPFVNGQGGGEMNDDDDVERSTTEVISTTASNSYAYILYKPVGWSILGDKKKRRNDGTILASEDDNMSAASVTHDGLSNQSQQRRVPATKTRRVKAYDEQLDDFTFVEYNEEDVLAAMTPSERAELMMEGGFQLDDVSADAVRDALSGSEWDDDDDDDYDGVSEASAKKRTKMKQKKDTSSSTVQVEDSTPLRRSTQKANLETISRPSLVNWLKENKANEGTPIKGGKYWIALAGATEIDDSGLVLLCPRDRVDAVNVEESSYVAVVGNGKKVTSRSRLLKAIRSSSSSTAGKEACDTSLAKVDILSRLKKWREDDPIATVSLTFPVGVSTCNHAVLLCQDRFGDGVRGDAMADSLDRRSPRRMVHCTSLSASSSSSSGDASKSDDAVVPTSLPDDIASYANRRDGSSFSSGDFLGRRNGLGRNALTTAYREVNGASDGHPGWIVDRYGKWLFVQHHHDGEEGLNSLAASSKGPLPSLHDGYTAGVYYLPTWADRSVMGSERMKPTLLEGKAAPEYIPIVENGVQYLVNLGDSFSTGIFLDQRLQRAYLAGVCNSNTRVLNCFAHTGAFSVAAATAGARTVSLDLEKKWLDRIRPQLEANGIVEWEGRHDCLFGDCFDWLARLAKRGEQFDIVILDPPSTSVGKKKKRWSVKNDMAELVSLAAPLVKSNGLLFTTTNSASLRTEKFGNMCRKGLLDAGVQNPRLERISPMPNDFTSIGPQPVKNLVWRIP